MRREAVRVSDVKREQGCFRLMLEDAGRLREVTCRRLIAADGGGSRVRRALYPALTANTLTAVQAHFPAGDFPAEYACYYDHRCTPACGWSLVKDDRLIVGGAFARQGASAAFAAFEAAVFRQLGRPAPARLKTEACPVVWPLKAADLLLGDDDVLFAGEAAGLISASSFEGISFALESGYAAARAILSGQPRAAAYRRAIGYLLDKHRLRRIKARLLANRRLRTWIIRSGVAQVRPKAR